MTTTITIQDKSYTLTQGQGNNKVYISSVEDSPKPIKRYFATMGTLQQVTSSIKRYPVLWGSVIERELKS